MTRMNYFAGTCAMVLATAGTGCGLLNSGGTDVVPRVSLAGNWALNAAESSDTAHVSVRGLERGRRTQPDPDAPAAPGPAGTSRGRPRNARVEGDLAARVLVAARSHIERLTIADSGSVIALRGNEQTRVALSLDGRSVRQKWLDGSTVDMRARWVEQRLQIVRRVDGGITVQEYYSRSRGGSRLVVFSIVTGPFDGELTVRRVYDLVGE
jgi:hypothetical protein